MPNKNYIRGRNAEYKVVEELRRQGAVLAQRSAGSNSPIDVFAIMPDGTIRLIQVKTGSSPDELNKLTSLPVNKFASKELWHWIPRKGWEITEL